MHAGAGRPAPSPNPPEHRHAPSTLLHACTLVALGAVLLPDAVARAAESVVLETVAELQQPPGNVAVTPDRRIVLSQHQFFGPDHAVVERVERYGDKPVSDGITIDTGGNVYVSDLGAGAIGVTGADGRYRVLVRDQRLQWPDGFAAGADGYVYVTANQLHRSAPLNRGRETAEPPYHLFRFRPLAPVVPGR